MGTGRPEVQVGVSWASTQLSWDAWQAGTLPPPQQDLLVQPILATWPHGSSWPPFRPPCRIGGEKVILLSASAWGFITVATPLLAHLGSAHLAFMTFSRILTGLLQGRGPKHSRARDCVHMCVCVHVYLCIWACVQAGAPE